MIPRRRRRAFRNLRATRPRLAGMASRSLCLVPTTLARAFDASSTRSSSTRARTDSTTWFLLTSLVDGPAPLSTCDGEEPPFWSPFCLAESCGRHRLCTNKNASQCRRRPALVLRMLHNRAALHSRHNRLSKTCTEVSAIRFIKGI